MLLIFFLVTSSMDATKGVQRQLPPPPQDQEQVADIQREDIMTVVMNADGTLTANDQPVSLEQLEEQVREFAAVNPRRRVVAIKTHPQATYNDYFQLQNTLVTAYRPLKCPPRVSEIVEEKGGDTDL